MIQRGEWVRTIQDPCQIKLWSGRNNDCLVLPSELYLRLDVHGHECLVLLDIYYYYAEAHNCNSTEPRVCESDLEKANCCVAGVANLFM